MNTSDAALSIREFNLSYLLLAQRLVREDKAIGMFRLGLSAEMADIIQQLSLAQVVKLASSEQLLCMFRFSDHGVLSALTQTARHVEVAPTHAAILLASQPAEQFA
jgi:flagellar transcriptional activator FlhD